MTPLQAPADLWGASWLVTDRKGGTSQGAFATNNLAYHVGDDREVVTGNREEVATRLGARHVVFARAVHGSRVEVVTGPADDVEGADSLITRAPGIGVAAMSADCAAVVIADSTGWVAAAHCGWQGLVAGVVSATVAALANNGADMASLRAHVGPVICAGCYPVQAARAEQVAQILPGAATVEDGVGRVDVGRGVRAQLEECGVRYTADPRCTFESKEFYSYRRDGVTGRQAAVIMSGRS